MTGREFLEALATLGWSQRHLTELLRCDTKLAGRWSRGTAVVPLPIAGWLRGLVECHEAHPVPGAWRVLRVAGHDTIRTECDTVEGAEREDGDGDGVWLDLEDDGGVT